MVGTHSLARSTKFKDQPTKLFVQRLKFDLWSMVSLVQCPLVGVNSSPWSLRRRGMLGGNFVRKFSHFSRNLQYLFSPENYIFWLFDKGLAERSERMGTLLRGELATLPSSIVKQVLKLN